MKLRKRKHHFGFWWPAARKSLDLFFTVLFFYAHCATYTSCVYVICRQTELRIRTVDECMYVYITNSCWLYISVREYVFSQHIAITWIAFTWNNKQLRIYIANSYADSQWAAICVVHTHTSIYMYYNHFIFLFYFCSLQFVSFSICLFVCLNHWVLSFSCAQIFFSVNRRTFWKFVGVFTDS